MEAVLKSHLTDLAARYAAATGVPLTTIGSRAINHSKFFERLADPETSITLKTYDRVVQWFADNWPKGAKWPSKVARPVLDAA